MALNLYRSCPGPIRGVLFDMDGLVLGTEGLYCRFWREAAQSLGFPMTREQALGMRSLTREAGQQRLWDWFGPEADYDAVRRVRIERMDAYVANHPVAAKPGIEELLDALDELGIPKAIASSSPHDRIRAYLTPLGLYHRFDQICSSRDVAHGKPAPDIYRLAAARLGVPAESCLALEDSPTGILSAYRAGCRCILVPDQDQPDSQTQSLLWAKADTLADVMELLPNGILS